MRMKRSSRPANMKVSPARSMLAKYSSTSPRRCRARPRESDLQQRRLDDGADVHPRLAGDALAGDVHAAFGVAEQFAVAFVMRQRVAAVLDEPQHVLELARGRAPHRARRGALRRTSSSGMEWALGRGQQQMLREHVEPAGARRIAVQFARGDACDRGLAFQDFEAVGRARGSPGSASSMRWLVRPTRCSRRDDAFGRADLDHLVHAAPIDAEIERGGGDDRAQLAGRHGRFDALALRQVQAAVMQRDRQRVVVELPQFLEQQFALGARIDEHDRHARAFDPFQHGAGGGQAHAAGPGDARFRQQHADRGRCALGDFDQPGRAAAADEVQQRLAVRDGRGQADAAGARGQGGQARQAQCQLVAALGAGEGVDLVDHDRAPAPRRRPAHLLATAAAPGFRAWSAGYRAGFRAGAGGCRWACRRCACRCGWGGAYRRPERSGCGRCLSPAPSAG